MTKGGYSVVWELEQAGEVNGVHVFILNDREDAGRLTHDLVDQQSVCIFCLLPSTLTSYSPVDDHITASMENARGQAFASAHLHHSPQPQGKTGSPGAVGGLILSIRQTFIEPRKVAWPLLAAKNFAYW